MASRKFWFGILVFMMGFSLPIQAQSGSLSPPDLPNTLEETIRLFPNNLQSGFRSIYLSQQALGISSSQALETIQQYYLCNWVKVNYILTGKGDELGGGGLTYAQGYNRMRGALIQALGQIVLMVNMTGHPAGGNDDWDTWGFRLLEWL